MARKRTNTSTTKSSPAVAGDTIEIRGARQNNLKGIDLDIPVGQLVVVTGPSGSGKSSLAFQTLYAEGQRRYVETFSPYTRQFFDRMDKPQVDSIRGIPPAIAIEQQNAVKTTRSTVGTITEINEYLKLFFPRLAKGYDPVTGEEISPDTPESILRDSVSHFGKDDSLLVVFAVDVPEKTKPADFFAFLQSQGYLRTWIYGTAYRSDNPEAYEKMSLPARVDVIQDRVAPSRKSRFLEAVERALDLGKGVLSVVQPSTGERLSFSRDWSSPTTGTVLRPPTPGLFSFNHPLGACPTCRGFGRVIGIDYDKAIPDKSLSIAEGLVRAFQGDSHRECEEDLERCARRRGLSLVKPFDEMSPEEQRWIIDGEPGDPDELWEQGRWYGIRGFFQWLESRAYRMHIRVFLSRYRDHTLCPVCRGSRLRPEALAFRIAGKTLPELWQMPVEDLGFFFDKIRVPKKDKTATMLHTEIRSRLGYLKEVGLGYLSLDRPTRTLSGGEIERVNLTTCLGASLTSTLFVLDEPTVGLHPRDVGKLIGVMQHLRDLGNTIVVVEHEAAVIRAADHLVDVGPGRGESGGSLVYTGPGPAAGVQTAKVLKAHPTSLTLQYLAGEKSIPIPTDRRQPSQWLKVQRAAQHNLKKIDVAFPLGVICCVTGVSGSGKTTLVHSVLCGNLLTALGQPTGEMEVGQCRGIVGAEQIREVVLVDQSPLARTPRSTPAVYTGIFDTIRKLFAASPLGEDRQLTPGYFSFNSGVGRCRRCLGNGFEKVEMQFLSDLYVTCPECEGRRYTKEALEVHLNGKNIDEVLSLTGNEALEWFAEIEDKSVPSILSGLQLLSDVGLGYLRLGQPLNTLSGGESQRLKLVGHLLAQRSKARTRGKKQTTLLLFDEPTTGLHFDDTARLLEVFAHLVEGGDSVVVVEHNLDVIASADYVIDLGPEAGEKGGHIVVQGTPEEVAACAESRTGAYLRERLAEDGRRVGESTAALSSASRATNSAAVKSSITAPTNGSIPAAPHRATSSIELRGARENNLKNISLSIPRDEFVVITGLSGSGKSTIAFDILFAEGQRRFLDSMSTYARQFVEQMERPDIDLVSGLPPTVAIEQRISRGGGKSTVATVTEVWQFLRLLFSKVGCQYSPDTGNAVVAQTPEAIVEQLRAEAKKAKAKPTLRITAPLIRARKGYHTEVAEWARKQGFESLLVDGKIVEIRNFKRLKRFNEHTIDVIVGEITSRTPRKEVAQLVETALHHGKRTLRCLFPDGTLIGMNTERVDPETGRSFEELDPRLFSYNSPHGWCPTCRGYGWVEARNSLDERDADSVLDAELREERRRSHFEEDEITICPDCEGTRLNEAARHVRIGDLSITDLARLSVSEAQKKVAAFSFASTEALIARDILPEITQRLHFMEEVGLGYLQLDRSATTLSGGESQRIRLAAQLGSNLRGVLYVLDEPTIGLHPRDNQRLLVTLANLKEKGNSLVVVEHDEDTIRHADHLIDLGPGAGSEGGEVVWQGDPDEIFHPKKASTKKKRTANTKTEDENSALGVSSASIELSPTFRAFATTLVHPLRGERRPLPKKSEKDAWITVQDAHANNLKNIEASIPIGRLTVISGVSGSGKSSLLRRVIKPAITDAMERAKAAAKKAREKSAPASSKKAAKKSTTKKVVKKTAPTWSSITGADNIETVYEVDQSPIGKTSRSTPATYVKVFDEIRSLFAMLPESRARGYTPSRFSFNTEGGRCETCKGNGSIKLEMNFLPTSYIQCDECAGRRYNSTTLEILYRGKSIGDVMDLSVEEACEFFAESPKIARTLELMRDTGLGYLKLGQPSPHLSGGEAQRIKLVSELTKGVGRANRALLRQNRKLKSILYLIEEPSIGLHLSDVTRLLELLHRLVDEGHTVVVIEHSLEIIAEADYLIDIGPEAGDAGGTIVAAGTPEKVAKSKKSRTAPFLAEKLG